MRLTRETLIKIARDAANQRARVSRRIVCIYLTGSVLGDTPLLGGTTDIDLIVIHDSDPIQPREVVRMSDEIHLDIGHYSQDVVPPTAPPARRPLVRAIYLQQAHGPV